MEISKPSSFTQQNTATLPLRDQRPVGQPQDEPKPDGPPLIHTATGNRRHSVEMWMHKDVPQPKTLAQQVLGHKQVYPALYGIVKNLDRLVSAKKSELSDSDYISPDSLSQKPGVSHQEKKPGLLYIRKDTLVEVAGKPVPVNYVRWNNDKGISEDVGMMCHYPTLPELPAHIGTIYEKMPCFLGVLAQEHEAEGMKTIEYAREDGHYPPFKVETAILDVKPLPSRDADGQDLTVEYGLMSMTKAGSDKTVQVPTFHVRGLEDNAAMEAGQMATIIDDMQKYVKKYSGEPGRLPMGHCRAGVGRMGQFMAAWLLATNPNAKSLVKVLFALMASRAKETVYAPKQKTELCRLAAGIEKPVFAAPPNKATARDLKFAGYEDLTDAHYPDLLSAIKEYGCDVEENTANHDDVEEHLARITVPFNALRLAVKGENGKTIRTMFWRATEDCDSAIDMESGEMFKGTPNDFWEKEIVDKGIRAENVSTALVLPRLTAGQVALVTDEQAEHVQCALGSYTEGATDNVLGNWSVSEINAFLNWRNGTEDALIRWVDWSEASKNTDLHQLLTNTKHPFILAYEEADDDEENGLGEESQYGFRNLALGERNTIAGKWFSYEGLDNMDFTSIDDLMGHIMDTVFGGEDGFIKILSLDKDMLVELDKLGIARLPDADSDGDGDSDSEKTVKA